MVLSIEQLGDKMNQAKVSNKEIIKKIMLNLQEKLNSIVEDPQAMADYLLYMSRFYQGRSFRNMCLIYFTKPSAEIVATYKQWIDKGRIVVACTGCRAIKNKECQCPERLAPTRIPQLRPVHRKAEIEDPKNTDEKKLIEWTSFWSYYVFDISDTEQLTDKGERVEDPKRPKKIEGDYGQEIINSVKSYLTGIGWNYSIENYADASDGYTQFEPKIIKIQANQSISAQASTTLHEMGHFLLHEKLNYKECRDIAEVEAESVAFIVGSFFGLDTSQHSVRYIDGWANGDHEIFLKSLENIFNASQKLIDIIEK